MAIHRPPIGYGVQLRLGYTSIYRRSPPTNHRASEPFTDIPASLCRLARTGTPRSLTRSPLKKPAPFVTLGGRRLARDHPPPPPPKKNGF